MLDQQLAIHGPVKHISQTRGIADLNRPEFHFIEPATYAWQISATRTICLH